MSACKHWAFLLDAEGFVVAARPCFFKHHATELAMMWRDLLKLRPNDVRVITIES